MKIEISIDWDNRSWDYSIEDKTQECLDSFQANECEIELVKLGTHGMYSIKSTIGKNSDVCIVDSWDEASKEFSERLIQSYDLGYLNDPKKKECLKKIIKYVGVDKLPKRLLEKVNEIESLPEIKWIIPKKLAGCKNDLGSLVDYLYSNNIKDIKTVLSFGDETQIELPSVFDYKVITFESFQKGSSYDEDEKEDPYSYYPSIRQLREACDFIEEKLSKDVPTIVCCEDKDWLSQILATYLVHIGVEPLQALKELKNVNLYMGIDYKRLYNYKKIWIHFKHVKDGQFRCLLCGKEYDERYFERHLSKSHGMNNLKEIDVDIDKLKALFIQ